MRDVSACSTTTTRKMNIPSCCFGRSDDFHSEHCILCKVPIHIMTCAFRSLVW
jgi:hypothetical protein